MIKISRLYLRILGAFILVQFIAILVMFILMRTGKIRPPFTRWAEERTASLKALVERDIGGAVSVTPDLKLRIDNTLEIFEQAFRGNIWISDQTGRAVFKSDEQPIPPIEDFDYEHEYLIPEGGALYLVRHEDKSSVYAVTSTQIGNTPLTIHILHGWKKHKEEAWFMRGLLLTATIAALLLIPATRRITRPLNQLTDSAQKVGKGDFSPRVKVRGKGEITDLANTFNRMAESLEKMIRGGRELTANLSHELRSPLARIRLSQQITYDRLEDGRTEGVLKHLDKMESEINHMDGLIDKILSLSKLDLQEQQPHTDIVDLVSMVREAIERQHPLMCDKEIQVSQQCAGKLPFTCRAEDIRMVLDNVIANAVKYSADKAVINISCHEDESEITIQFDTPYKLLCDSELETIFIPFKRLGYDKVEGNGLGLAFSKKLVEDHGGTMRASSELNVFSMTMRFPKA